MQKKIIITMMIFVLSLLILTSSKDIDFEIGDNSYTISKDTINGFIECQEYCEKIDANLACIADYKEDDEIRKKLK